MIARNAPSQWSKECRRQRFASLVIGNFGNLVEPSPTLVKAFSYSWNQIAEPSLVFSQAPMGLVGLHSTNPDFIVQLLDCECVP